MLETKSRSTLESILSALDGWTKLLAVLAAGCIALSVVFDWGYLSALSLGLSEVPTSLADHTRSAILWLPFASLLIPVAIVISFMSDRIDAKKALDAESNGVAQLDHLLNESRRAKRNLAITGIILFVLWLLLGERFFASLLMVSMIIWMFVVMYATSATKDNWKQIHYWRLGLYAPVIIIVALYVTGYSSALVAIAPGKPVGEILLRSNSEPERMKGNVVRSFERAVIIIDDHQQIILLKPDDITRVIKASQSSYNEGLLCKYWGLVCPKA